MQAFRLSTEFPACAGMTVLVVCALHGLGGPRLRGDDGAGRGVTVPKGTVIPAPRVAEPGISIGVLSLSRGLLLQAFRLSTEFPALSLILI